MSKNKVNVQKVYAMIKSGFPDAAVAKLCGVSTRSVAAYRAHVTMGNDTKVNETVTFKLPKKARKALENGSPVNFTV